MKTIITSFIAGILLTIFVLHAYTVYQLRAQVRQHQAVIEQVVGFINQSIQAQQAQQK
jgi:Tfp pilus assembly protein PilE